MYYPGTHVWLRNMALTEIQEKVQVCENNWMRRIVGVKTADKRRMDKLRMDIGAKDSFKKKLVRSRLKWAGHVERKGDEKLAKGADAQKVKGKEDKEGRECDGRTVLREIQKDGEENGEDQQQIKDC